MPKNYNYYSFYIRNAHVSLPKKTGTSSGHNYLLLATDMAKVGGPLFVVKACASMLCVKIEYRYVGGPLSVVKVFTEIWTSQVSSAIFVGYSYN